MWKVFKGTKFVSLKNVDLDAAFAQADAVPDIAPAKPVGWLKFVSWIWD